MKTDPETLYWNLKNVNVGIRVIPCYQEDDGKLKPAVKWKDKREMEESDYEEWLESYDWNDVDGIGYILPDDVVGLDIDCKGGKNGAKRIKEYLKDQGIEPEKIKRAPVVRTPNNGFHYYFRENGDDLTKKTGVIEGVDIQAGRSGALLFAPPSQKDGGRYQWENGRDLMTQPLPEVPEWLKDLAKQDQDEGETEVVDTSSVDPSTVLSGVQKGQRNEKLFRYTCRLRANNYQIHEAKVLVQTAAKNCDPEYPSEGEEEPEDMVERVWKEYEPGDESLQEEINFDLDREQRENAESVQQLSEWVDQRHRSKEEYPEENIRTGIQQLDEVTNAIEPDEFVIIGGQPKSGKTTLALQILSQSTQKHDNEALFVSLEMSVRDVMLKIAHCRTRTNMNKTIKGQQMDRTAGMVSNFFEQYTERVEAGENDIHVSTPGKITVRDFCQIVRQYNDRHGLDFAMLDYFQFLANPEPQIFSLNDYLTEASKQLRELALDLEIPIFVISRQNKAGTTYGTSAVSYDMTTGIEIEREGEGEERYINANRVRLAPGGSIKANLIGAESRFANFHLEN